MQLGGRRRVNEAKRMLSGPRDQEWERLTGGQDHKAEYTCRHQSAWLRCKQVASHALRSVQRVSHLDLRTMGELEYVVPSPLASRRS